MTDHEIRAVQAQRQAMDAMHQARNLKSNIRTRLDCASSGVGSCSKGRAELKPPSQASLMGLPPSPPANFLGLSLDWLGVSVAPPFERIY
eukprot:CAMPEP_0113723390 /NCGR_PEP_ID=MMETSP0038_2-20120614/38391_1 /TAXON_ID=2898 /ORGANISM="Cryptomonas paramecium" /LENGTH=89 /DNA_ID=CAMNT_0000652963 /DNA_START=153 /DNA_END=422 /DNA_ORIENTATION=+ /assembly_acc=CAM_ASM_000170